MSGKKVSIIAKPSISVSTEEADKWVDKRIVNNEIKEKMKRLTIDIPDSLHKAIKSDCALRGKKIADEVRELLSIKYGKK